MQSVQQKSNTYVTIDSIASGGNTSGDQSNGDSLKKLFFSLKYPYGICVDLDGNVLVSDSSNHKIVRILRRKGMLIETVAGDGVAGFKDGPLLEAQFNHPRGICLDKDGNLLVADRSNNRIRKVNLLDGVVETLTGDGVPGFKDGGLLEAQFNYPRGLCLDSEGNVIVVDSFNHRIRRVLIKEGVVETLAGDGFEGYIDGDALKGRLNYPRDVCVDDDGDIYITDCLEHRIRKLKMKERVLETVAGDGTEGNRDGPLLESKFNFPCGICIDSEKNILVTQNHSIRMICLDKGIVETIGGITGEEGFKDGKLSESKYNHPFGLCLDLDGNLLVVDSYNNRIRRIRRSVPLHVRKKPNVLKKIYSYENLRDFKIETKDGFSLVDGFVLGLRNPSLMKEPFVTINSNILSYYIEYLYTDDVNLNELTMDDLIALQQFSEKYEDIRFHHLVSKKINNDNTDHEVESNFETCLDSIKNFENYDVILTVTDALGKKEKFFAHKAILGNRCKFFEDLFLNDKNVEISHQTSLSLKAFEALFKYCYDMEWKDIYDEMDWIMIIRNISKYKFPVKDEKLITSHLQRRIKNIINFDGIIRKSLSTFSKEIIYDVLYSSEVKFLNTLVPKDIFEKFFNTHKVVHIY